jgi:acetyl esterase
MALDRATRELLDQLAAAGGKPLPECTPEEARADGAEYVALAGPGPEMARVEQHAIPVPGGSVPLRVLVPEQGARGVIVYYHGGGWVLGTLDEFDSLGRKLAERTSCAVVLVDYRLAPEHRYPTAVDDCYGALEWVAAHASEIAGRDVPLMVAGDSAGGNLAAVVAIRARDRRGPPIALQVLVYPVADADFDRPSYLARENQNALLSRDDMIWFWDHYLPDASRRTEPDASPIHTPDLAGLPPAVVITAEHDVLLDEGKAYAERLDAAGVPVEYRCYERQAHGFFTLLMLPEGERALQQVVKAVRATIAKHVRRVALTAG